MEGRNMMNDRLILSPRLAEQCLRAARGPWILSVYLLLCVLAWGLSRIYELTSFPFIAIFACVAIASGLWLFRMIPNVAIPPDRFPKTDGSDLLECTSESVVARVIAVFACMAAAARDEGMEEVCVSARCVFGRVTGWDAYTSQQILRSLGINSFLGRRFLLALYKELLVAAQMGKVRGSWGSLEYRSGHLVLVPRPPVSRK